MQGGPAATAAGVLGYQRFQRTRLGGAYLNRKFTQFLPFLASVHN
jgi:hypothetical protein